MLAYGADLLVDERCVDGRCGMSDSMLMDDFKDCDLNLVLASFRISGRFGSTSVGAHTR